MQLRQCQPVRIALERQGQIGAKHLPRLFVGRIGFGPAANLREKLFQRRVVTLDEQAAKCVQLHQSRLQMPDVLIEHGQQSFHVRFHRK